MCSSDLFPESAGNPILDKTASWDHVKEFTPAIQAAKADGAIVLCQISHAGELRVDGPECGASASDATLHRSSDSEYNC